MISTHSTGVRLSGSLGTGVTFLKFLAASPLFASLPARAWQTHTLDEILASPKDALDVMDFEAAARKALPPAHWGYMASGVDDNMTRDINHEAYRHIELRPRKLVDVSKISTSVELFGTTWDSPIFLCPVGAQGMFHADGEIGVARAAQTKKTLQILSTVTSHSVEDVIKARGGPVWYQLYAVSNWGFTERIAKRAEDAGCPVLAWTIDLLAGRNTETASRYRRIDDRQCADCHGEPFGSITQSRPMFDGLDMKGVTINSPTFTWENVDRLKKATKMKLILKGIETREDARLVRGAWRGWDPGVQSRRARDGNLSRHHRMFAGGVGRRGGPHSRCWWTAAFAAAPTFTRRWRSAPRRWASGVRTSGAFRRSGRRAWKR